MKQDMASTKLQKISEARGAQDDKDGGNFATGFVVGGLMAAAGVFLFSTKKGERTMERLNVLWKRFQNDAGGELGTLGKEMQSSQRPLLQSLGEIMSHVADDLNKEKKSRKRK